MDRLRNSALGKITLKRGKLEYFSPFAAKDEIDPCIAKTADAIEKNDKLVVGKGRSDPQAMPEPDRPDTSFFWLSSPWKSAVHIFWKNYKYWIVTIFCIALACLLAYDFMDAGVSAKAMGIFG